MGLQQHLAGSQPSWVAVTPPALDQLWLYQEHGHPAVPQQAIHRGLCLAHEVVPTLLIEVEHFYLIITGNATNKMCSTKTRRLHIRESSIVAVAICPLGTGTPWRYEQQPNKDWDCCQSCSSSRPGSSCHPRWFSRSPGRDPTKKRNRPCWPIDGLRKLHTRRLASSSEVLHISGHFHPFLPQDWIHIFANCYLSDYLIQSKSHHETHV